MPVEFSNIDMHLSQCMLKKHMERSLQHAGELDTASSSCSAEYCQQCLPLNSGGGARAGKAKLRNCYACYRWGLWGGYDGCELLQT